MNVNIHIPLTAILAVCFALLMSMSLATLAAIHYNPRRNGLKRDYLGLTAGFVFWTICLFYVVAG